MNLFISSPKFNRLEARHAQQTPAIRHFFRRRAYALIALACQATAAMPDGHICTSFAPASATISNSAGRAFWCSTSTTATSSSSGSKRPPAARRSRTTSRASAPAPRRSGSISRRPTKLYCVDLRQREDALGKGAAERDATGCRSRRTARSSTCRRSRRTLGTSSTRRLATLVTSIETKSGAHNTVVSRDGQRMYLGGLKSPILFVADTKTHQIVQTSRPVRRRDPAVHGQRRADAGLCLRQRLPRL